MRIIAKNILGNILANKRRTLTLILCMAVVAFSAMLSFSVAGSVKRTILGVLSQEFGDASILAYNSYHLAEELRLPEEAEPFYVVLGHIETQKRLPENFIYATKHSYTVQGMNVGKAQKKGFFRYQEPLTLGENQVIVSEAMAKAEELQVGDCIDIQTAGQEPLTLEVAYILPNERYLKTKGATVVAERALCEAINGKTGVWDMCYIATGDGEPPAGLLEQIIADNANFAIENLFAGAKEGYTEVFVLFFGIFFVLALIIFVVVMGISEHIVRERMAFLGTLRSIGATRGMALLVMLGESVFYGLAGAVVGTLLYIPANRPLIDIFMIVSENFERDYSIRAFAVLLVVCITVAISCTSAVFAIRKAIKTPIRDIIFGTQDTAYCLSMARTVAGIVMLAAGLAVGIFVKHAALVLLALVLFSVDVAFVMPFVLDRVCRLFDRGNHPVLRFSFVNIRTKKMNVGSVVLYTLVIGLVAAVLLLVCDIRAIFSEEEYGGDIMILELEKEADNYRFIETMDAVAEVELVYERYEFAAINGNRTEKEVPVLGYDGAFSLYNGVRNLPDALRPDEVVLDEKMMLRYGIAEGDTVELTLNARGERPIRLALVAVSGCDSEVASYGERNAILLNLDTYRKYFFDYPNAALVRLEDKERAEQVCESIRTFLMDKYAMTYTQEEYRAREEASDQSLFAILYLIIAIGSLLAFILLVTNQGISFEQRKKEFAVLHSTSMSRKQLARMLFCENAFSLLIATAAAFLTGLAAFYIIINFVAVVGQLAAAPRCFLPEMCAFLAVAYVLSLLAGAGNVRRLKRMNTAEQMKYE